MKRIEYTLVEWFLRISLSFSFLSAVADRLGLWSNKYSIFWGNWHNFVQYTHTITSFIHSQFAPILAYAATIFEVVFGVLLLVPYKTHVVARLSGLLLLCFAVSMAITIGIKSPLDYSVFSAAAAAFALSIIAR